jgi:hypothetical protein
MTTVLISALNTLLALLVWPGHVAAEASEVGLA